MHFLLLFSVLFDQNNIVAEGLPWWLSGNEPACQCRRHRRQFLGWEDPLGKEMATHSSILAWGLPWTEEPGGLQSVGLQESDTTERPYNRGCQLLLKDWPVGFFKRAGVLL